METDVLVVRGATGCNARANGLVRQSGCCLQRAVAVAKRRGRYLCTGREFRQGGVVRSSIVGCVVVALSGPVVNAPEDDCLPAIAVQRTPVSAAMTLYDVGPDLRILLVCVTDYALVHTV